MTFPSSLSLPAAVIEIVTRLEEAGFESWCVGGAIRDRLLQVETADVDVATAASPEQVQALFRRTIDVGARFGTIGVFGADGVLHEVTSFRRDVETDGRHAVVAFGASIDEDLARRDFTINAIAYHPLRQAWRDNYDGVGDLERRVVRAVGVAEQRFREDYLRILRAIRFAGRFGFALEPETEAAARALSSGLSGLSAERVHDEWTKALDTVPDLAGLVGLWQSLGVASVWMPELLPAEVVRRLSLPAPGARDVVIITAALTVAATPVFRRLKASNREISRAEAITAGPGMPASADAVTVRQWMARVGDAADDLCRLAEIRDGRRPAWSAVVDQVHAGGEATSRAELKVSGADLIAAGFPPGPQLGALLDRLLERVLVDPSLNTRERLLALAAGAT